MPRDAIKEKKHMYALSDLSRTIIGRMHGNYTQKEIGELLAPAQIDKAPMSQQVVSSRIKSGKFTYMELVILFDVLKFSDDEIVRCMRGAKSV